MMKTDSDRLKVIAHETAIAALATAAGAWTAHRAGFALFVYIPNVAAIALGAAALFWPAAITRIVRKYGVVALPALMILTIFTRGMESVHRWIALGPIRLNVSMAVAPAILFLIWDKPGRASLLLAVFTASIYVLQPDAGQAAAFAVSACLLISGSHQIKKACRWAAVMAIAGLAAAAYFRPDSLAPVPYVEQVFQLAFSGGLANLFAVLVCAAGLFIPFGTDAPAGRKTLAFAFLAYFICCFAVTQVGNFPVPVVGAGAGPVLGWFFGLVLMAEPSRDFSEELIC
jgi:hypothetical protein